SRTGHQLIVDHNSWNALNPQLLGALDDPTVVHAAHDDFIRRTGLLPHCVNYSLTDYASRAEHLHSAFGGHLIWDSLYDGMKQQWVNEGPQGRPATTSVVITQTIKRLMIATLGDCSICHPTPSRLLS